MWTWLYRIAFGDLTNGSCNPKAIRLDRAMPVVVRQYVEDSKCGFVLTASDYGLCLSTSKKPTTGNALIPVRKIYRFS
jgi:hypothetical protein